ncbi:MAG: hypothetical protein HZA51_16775 [Planctomycetes bacterium]|nr:hypothetical protein [Planctomycetota bacterium]
MNLKKAQVVLVWGLSVGAAVIIGCDSKSDSTSKPSIAALSPLLPNGFFLTKEPAGAKSVEEVKKAVKAGDTVIIQGRVGGSKEPFVDGRAVFTLIGSGLHHCGEKGSPMPDCDTPWDYCCDTPKDIAAHSAIVQVVDAGGAPLKVSLKGQNGMKELSNLVVVGKVSQADGKPLVINATGAFLRHE